ncbi:hemolysin [Vibrio cholerae]|nr:hemolysin [Vibrio cholerae]
MLRLVNSKVSKSCITKCKLKRHSPLGVVYLFGYVSPEHAEMAIGVARNIIGVKQVVKAFDYAQ